MIGAMPAVAVRHERQKQQQQQKRSNWPSSIALQSPLSISGLTMIGAMPAVAVRHERRKQEKRHKRPSQLGLGLQSPLSHTEGLGLSGSPDALALQSSPHRSQDGRRQEFYVCGKVSVLHVVVVSLLLGAILMIVGLVQLTPGADASQHRYLLLAAGGALLLLGVVLAAVRCCLLPWYARRIRLRSHAQPKTQPHNKSPVTPPGSSQSQGGGITQVTGTAAHVNSQDGSGSGSGSFKDGGCGPSRASSGRSRANSTTNGQVGRVGGRGSLCSPTGNQRRRSIVEAERGEGASGGGARRESGPHGERATTATDRAGAGADRSERRESLSQSSDNHHSELSVVNEAGGGGGGALGAGSDT